MLPPRSRRHIASVHALTAMLVAAVTACSSPGRRAGGGTQTPPMLEPATTAPRAEALAELISLEDWPAETFALPPVFAPELPTGSETLRFAPGWRDPTAETFWSYAFVMWIDEPTPDAPRLEHLLETYYSGLMSAFAAETEHDLSRTRPQVDLTPTAPGVYEGRMHLIDAFATFKPIDLRLVLQVAPESAARSVLSVQISPQPPHHPIWQSLHAAVSRIRTHHEAPHN